MKSVSGPVVVSVSIRTVSSSVVSGVGVSGGKAVVPLSSPAGVGRRGGSVVGGGA